MACAGVNMGHIAGYQVSLAKCLALARVVALVLLLWVCCSGFVALLVLSSHLLLSHEQATIT